jgi:hypothetical protein
MARRDDVTREVLSIPDRRPVSLTTYDAKNPDAKFPPIRQPASASLLSQRAHRLDRRCRL